MSHVFTLSALRAPIPNAMHFNFCERKLPVCRIHALFMSAESNDDFSWFYPLRKERLKAHSVHRTSN